MNKHMIKKRESKKGMKGGNENECYNLYLIS